MINENKRIIMNEYIDIAIFLIKQGLSFRGSKKNSGNFN